MTSATGGYAPTAEQEAIVDAFKTGENLTVSAVAGSGKTSSMKLVTKATPGRKLYLVFNKSAQVSAAKWAPPGTEVRTIHSVAYGSQVTPFAWRKKRLPGSTTFGRGRPSATSGPKAQSASMLAGLLGISRSVTVGGHEVQPSTLARIAKDTVRNFCLGDSRNFSAGMVPRQEWLSDDFRDRDELRQHVLPHAEAMWQDIMDPKGKINWEHDYYVKAWGLSNPVLGYDAILLDEAQDSNKVAVGVLANQQCQLVAVGDAQQAIYEWRGAVDAMTSFNPVHNLALTQSFRFGPAVAEVANEWLAELRADLRVRGFEKIESEVGPLSSPEAVLTRTNGGAMANVIQGLERGRKVHLVGGTKSIRDFAFAARDLMAGKRTDHFDLCVFKDWAEVKKAVSGDEAGGELKTSVKLVDQYGCSALINASKQVVAREDANLLVSTAHKSKGDEYETVRIHDDFTPPKEGAIPAADARLAYVAVTRAKKHLDPAGLLWLDEFKTEELHDLNDYHEEG